MRFSEGSRSVSLALSAQPCPPVCVGLCSCLFSFCRYCGCRCKCCGCYRCGRRWTHCVYCRRCRALLCSRCHRCRLQRLRLWLQWGHWLVVAAHDLDFHSDEIVQRAGRCRLLELSLHDIERHRSCSILKRLLLPPVYAHGIIVQAELPPRSRKSWHHSLLRLALAAAPLLQALVRAPHSPAVGGCLLRLGPGVFGRVAERDSLVQIMSQRHQHGRNEGTEGAHAFGREMAIPRP